MRSIFGRVSLAMLVLAGTVCASAQAGAAGRSAGAGVGHRVRAAAPVAFRSNHLGRGYGSGAFGRAAFGRGYGGQDAWRGRNGGDAWAFGYGGWGGPGYGPAADEGWSGGPRREPSMPTAIGIRAAPVLPPTVYVLARPNCAARGRIGLSRRGAPRDVRVADSGEVAGPSRAAGSIEPRIIRLR
jgi:hypothetical protein